MLFKQPYNKKLMNISFALYLVLLIWVIIFKWTKYSVVISSINKWSPLSIAQRWQFGVSTGVFHNWQPLDFLMNAVVFLPLGIFYAQMFKPKESVLFFALGLSATFEISQFFTCIGMFNIYDILANALGAIVGFAIYLCLSKLYTSKTLDIINSIVIPPASSIVVYAIWMTIANFEVYI